jgi:hypothetical protein
MIFAQITRQNSLSEIILCLNAVSHHLYHVGITSPITKSNFAHAKRRRNWKIFFGRNSNAVKSQIWIAVCVYLLIAILKKTFQATTNLKRNSTHFEHNRIRKNALFTSIFAKKYKHTPKLQTITTVRLIIGR